MQKLIKMNKKEAKEHLEKQREKQRRVMRKYYSENKDRYYDYVKRNADRVKIWYDRYRKSPKGKIAIQKYESKPHRKAAKAFWNFKNRLELKVKAGEITKSEMKKRINERLKK